MANSGWYPDPADPSLQRWWDGDRWTEHTAPGDPAAAAGAADTTGPEQAPPSPGDAPTVLPGSPSPFAGQDPAPSPPPAQQGWGGQPAQPAQPAQQWAQPAPPSQPGWVGGPPSGPPGVPLGAAPGGPGGGKGSKTVLLSVVGVVVVLALVVGGFFVVRSLTDDSGDDTASDDESSQSESPSDPTASTVTTAPGPDTSSSPAVPDPTESTDPAADECTSGDPMQTQPHPSDDRLYGGGLALPVPDGYQVYGALPAFAFASDVGVAVSPLAGNFSANYMLGSVDRSTFASLTEASQQVALCLSESKDFYPDDLNAQRELQESEATTAAGDDAWQSRIEMTFPKEAIKGGDILVIAVDLGDPDTYGIFVGIQELGDAKSRKDVVASLTTE